MLLFDSQILMQVSLTGEAFRIYDGEAWRGDVSPLQIHPQRGVFKTSSEAKPRGAYQSRSFHGSLCPTHSGISVDITSKKLASS